MATVDGVPLPAVLDENVASVSPAMLRAMITLFAGQPMGAEADFVRAEHDQAGERRVKLKYRNEVPPRNVASVDIDASQPTC